MGLLDDAIKQHLELKRQHGAAEEEVKRQEAEALGPARRDVVAPEPEETAVPEAESEPPLASHEPASWLDEEEPVAAEPATEVAPAEPVEHAAEPADETLAHEPLPAPDPVPTPPPPPEPELREEPSPLREDPPPPVERKSETPTQGFPAVSRDEPGEAPSDDEAEDVLEETPDFLQDTPEHDRLWFEQKPPRDFDFDG